ncbi:ligand-binding sensor domain-containing protein [Paraclostridium bifermentans]|uniref:ligand-binding sensor domain-containing protein n=1 Tax=Paraclostridium bifermentans TaxID=1490 RepID=UPI00359CB0D4
MRFKILIVFILLNILIPMKSWAATLSNAKFEHISIDEGLSNEYITSIFQDSKGYMWIGTKDGLNRYDGERIKIYNCNAEDKNTLSSTYITDIEEDSKGNIWIATDHGLDFLIKDTDTIVRMKDIKNKYNLGNFKITSLLKSSYEENIMWVGTEDGLIKINIEDKIVEAFYDDSNNSNSLTSASITCLEEGEENLLWVGTKSGLNVIDKNSKVLNSRSTKIIKDKLFIYYISKDKEGNMWISTKTGLFMYNISKGQRGFLLRVNGDGIKKYNINEGNIDHIYTFNNNEVKFYNNFIFNDSENNTWISGCDGAIKYSKEKREFNVFKKNINYKNSITSNVITCFYEDSNGTIWIGTDKGANILNDNDMFNYINKEDGKDIVSILRHDKKVWVATKFKGIYIYNEANGHLIKKIKEDEINLSGKYIKSLFEINDRYILISTNKGLIVFDTQEYLSREIIIGDDYSTELNYMYNDGKYIWLATTTDFYCYCINTGKKVDNSNNMKKLGINTGNIKYILQDNKDENIIWLGGVNIGLIKYHKQKGVLEKYVNDSLNENSLINDYINCMTFDNDGNLWIGTNIGLSKFDIKANKFTSYTTAEGLVNNFINSILIDDNRDIWVSTNKGLSKFDIKKNRFTNFTKMDGLYGYQFNLNSSLKLKSGTIIFGSTDGCTYFNPDDLIDYKIHRDEVVIGDIFIGKNKAVYDGNEMILEPDYKNLYINFFLPNYENLNNITYEYMLEGIDSQWIYLDSQSNLDFKTLEPGKYTLKIRARDGHGELTKENSINIRVKKPIWKTSLAYLIYISIIIGMAICIFNYVKILQHLVDQKTMKLNKQLEENKKLSEEIIDNEKFKNNYFVNLSHELRTPINVIVSTLQLIKLLSKDKNITYEKFNQYINIISKNCDNLLKIINDIIDSSKIETGKYKINKKNNDIVYIVEEAALNMSKFIEDKGLSLIIDPDMEEQIISCDETEIERCIINLIGNAVKFTQEGGEIRIYIEEVENNIEITIEDTGIGISKEDQEFIFKRFSQVDDGTGATKTSSSGIGLTLVKYIAELHGGYIKLESEVNKGSRFTIGIPNVVENAKY